VLVETAVRRDEGVTGLAGDDERREYLIDHGVGDVITQSFGRHGEHLPRLRQGDFSSIKKLRYAFQDANRKHVTVLASR